MNNRKRKVYRKDRIWVLYLVVIIGIIVLPLLTIALVKTIQFEQGSVTTKGTVVENSCGLNTYRQICDETVTFSDAGGVPITFTSRGGDLAGATVTVRYHPYASEDAQVDDDYVDPALSILFLFGVWIMMLVSAILMNLMNSSLPRRYEIHNSAKHSINSRIIQKRYNMYNSRKDNKLR